MTDCTLQQLPNGKWWCPECDPKKRRLLPVKARRNCQPGRAIPPRRPRQVNKATAAWRAAGKPKRDPAEAARLYTEFCEGCDMNVATCTNGKRRVCKYDHLQLPEKCEMATVTCELWTDE